jgi:HD-GYP domain-containing protein (c-di-GMP phosphodiesterase class II)
VQESNVSAFAVATLNENCRFSDEVTIEQNFLLCAPGLPITKDLVAALREWQFTEVQSEGTPEGGLNAQGEEIEQTPPEEKPQKSLSFNNALKKASELKNPALSDEERIAIVQSVYDQYTEYIDTLYTRYATHKELHLKDIAETIKTLCEFIAASKRYILRIQPKSTPENKNYLVNHSMRSTVLAIVMGMQLAMPMPKLVELGVSCMLHEIGMIRLPPQLYLTSRKLTPSEKKQLFIHPVVGYNILKDYAFPLAITLGVLEHHEKEDGSGYPRHVEGDKISILAKIISVACSYEAITSPRTYKSEENTHTAMVELLKNTGKQYDEAIVRALLFSISLYPIGAYVFLSDGKVGLVTDVNPENPKNPIVQLLTDRTPDGSPKIVVTDEITHKVSRILTPEETVSIKKSLKL